MHLSATLSRRFTLLVLLLGLPVASLLAQSTWYDKGKAASDNNRKVEYFTKALEQERKDAWVYYFRGWAYYGLGRYEKALNDFNAGLEAEGNLDASFLNSAVAWCKYRLEDYNAGLKAADKAIEGRESNSEAWNVRGWLLIMKERPTDAVASFTKYIALKPESSLGFSNRSYAYTLTKQFENVVADCDKALTMDPTNEFLLERKAFALMKLDRGQEGIELIKEKISYKPDDPLSLSNIGNLFYRNEDYTTAIDYHTRGMALYDAKIKDDREFIKIYRDDIYDIYMSRGDAYYALKDYQHALGDYKKATTLNPKNYRAWHEIGQLQTFQKNWSEGASAYEQAFAIKPDLTFGWVNLGFCYDNMNQPHRAIDAYTRGIENNPDVGLLYNNRGYGYLELKMYDKALADLKKAIEVEPDVVMSHVSLGEYYFDRKQFIKAIEKFSHALAMEDGSVQAYTAAYFTRGMCYSEREEYEKAKSDFRDAIKLTSDHVLAHEKLGITHYNLEEYCESYRLLKRTLDLESQVPNKQAKLAPRYLGKMTKNPCTN